MKKIICFIIVITTVISMFTAINGEVNLTDVKSTDWFFYDVNEMIELGVVNGYPDGTYKPQGNVKADEFIKMIIVGMGYTTTPTDSTYWADEYIAKAEELKIVDKTFINDYRYNLTREQAAKIINNTLNLKETRPAKTYDEYIKLAIKDYHKIQSKYVQDVIDIFAYGIMQGDTLGYIKPSTTITRAEATTVILRMMNKDRRLSLENKLSSNINSIKLIDAEGVEYEIVAPILDGKPITEIIEVARVYKEKSIKTKGCDEFGYNSYSNYIGVTGFENQNKVNYIESLKTKYELSNEELTKMAMYIDFNFGISLLELSGKYKPYKFVTNKNLGWLDDEVYKNKSGNWGAYFTEYYLDSFKPVFEILFDDDFNEAWGCFTTAINSTSTTYQSKTVILNERCLDMGYDAGGMQMTISLKNQWK